MEVADRTEADRKGGHIARRRGRPGLVLREIAQTPDEDVDAFQDIDRHRFFNTNTLWVDLAGARATLLDERDGVLGLPMIVNRKTVDPSDTGSPEVVQLETAMGAAIDVFDGARALRVPRRAVRAGEDDERPARAALGRLRADRRRARRAGRRARRPAGRRPRRRRTSSCSRDFEERFPAGAPSLVACERLTVEGDVRVRRATSWCAARSPSSTAARAAAHRGRDRPRGLTGLRPPRAAARRPAARTTPRGAPARGS